MKLVVEMADYKLRYTFPSGRRTVEFFDSVADAMARFEALSAPERGCTGFELQSPSGASSEPEVTI